MTEMVKYLAELVKAQLEGKKPGPVPEGISLTELEEFSRKNHINYLVLGALLKLDSLPEEAKQRFRPIVMKSVMKTAMQVAEVKMLRQRFEEKKIPNQFMKGSCLKFVYPSPEMREMSDLDILIGEDGMEQAAEVLVNMGYELTRSIKHHDIFQKKPYMVVEAHRAMYDKSVDKSQYEYFSTFSKANKMDGYEYSYEFSNEDFYVYMMAHMAKHFFQTGCGVRHLVDIYIFKQKYGATMDMAYTETELDRCGILTFTKHMEKLTEIWLNDEPSEALYDDLFDYMLGCGIYGKEENGMWSRFADEKKETISRSKMKLWYIFPPLHYMAEDYAYLEKHHWLLPWAWFVRGINGILKHKGSGKRKMLDEIETEQIKRVRNIYREMDLKFKH